MRIEASAPTRIDLAGGTYDIWPLYLFHDGAQTLNVALSLRASCTISPRADGRLGLVSADTHRSIVVDRWSDLTTTDDFCLLARILAHYRVEGADVSTRSDSPVGAGIAGSSALTIALCAALGRWTGRAQRDETLLSVAMNLEAQAIGVPTGTQDYRPALYGGAAAIILGVDGVRRDALAVDLDQLEGHVVLAYTGATRKSGINNWEVTKRHIEGDPEVLAIFDRITAIAREMREALERGDYSEAGRLLGEEWENRKRLAPGVSTPEIEHFIAEARRHGAWAGKICGAGGGGCLVCLAPPDAVPDVSRALSAAGARILDVHLERDGLRVTASDAD